MKMENLTMREFKQKAQEFKKQLGYAITDLLKEKCKEFNLYPEHIYITTSEARAINGEIIHIASVDIEFDDLF